ncbi:MAG: ATP-dependent Clp protease proteolytic subunit, partial [Dehalococcoidia bacterium]|nr:ATP-dependent Clp protease proteolytic subunit [Dehalococcoidia bacterium]
MNRHIRIILLMALLFLGVISLGVAQDDSSDIYILHVDGTIVPVVADYIDRGISEAEDNGAAAVVIELNTAGGMLSTTEDIVDRILESRVPVVVYVDRWAGSAGTFITMAAHVAAMAPASRIGAASPVSIDGDLSETMKKKLNEDTAAHIRGLADLRGRNQKAAEATVREALSFTDKEALGIAPISESQRQVLGLESPYLDPPLVDVGAKDIEELLVKIDGMQVKVGDEMVTIRTEGYRIHKIGMNFLERFLHVV